ncbi:hypothetical protein X773_16555 [Mesorhizobium sp. LSJC285A00]|nr:hypothetical protein X773_16555 [Mesorhizobium sp. LSJC285A00]
MHNVGAAANGILPFAGGRGGGFILRAKSPSQPLEPKVE